MEKDYKLFSEDTISRIKQYKIPYKWRDSCVSDLLELKQCEDVHPLTHFFQCSGLKAEWENCQFAREREIMSKENFVIVPEEQRRLSF